MACYLISYDLPADSDYEELIDAIKAYRTWAHITQSTWAVVTDLDAASVRDDLAQHVPDGSRLFVLRSGTEAAWKNVLCRNAWLKERL